MRLRAHYHFYSLLLGPHPLAARFLNRDTSAAIASLAVLPLDNLSGDPNEEYFADGMTDELTTMLAKDSTLRIVSRTSAMQFKSANRSLPEIARVLNVDGILEGSVSRVNRSGPHDASAHPRRYRCTHLGRELRPR